jgi:pimeloyl-ACP methyl ester carboxylesterase
LTPLVCLHGFMDTARTWDLALPALEREHEVLVPTLIGHFGGPPVEGELDAEVLADGVERAMDAAGFDTAHIAGNSLGGYLGLKLAERGRARSVVAFAPAGGWTDDAWRSTLALQARIHEQTMFAAPRAAAILSTPEGRRRATAYITVNYEHIPVGLLTDQLLGVAACDAVQPAIESAHRNGWPLDVERVTCPVRIVWGSEDRLLPWPTAAERYRAALPNADWVVLDGVGHSPQLDVPLEAAQLILGFTT